MPPEAYIAAAAGVIGFAGVVITALIKAPWKRSNGCASAVTNDDCDDRRESLGKIYDSKIKVVDTKLDGVMREQKHQGQTLMAIGDTTVEILKEIKFNNGK